METKICKEEGIAEGAALLKKGEVVAFPTETVYGLGALFFNREGRKKIYQVKNRPLDNPLIAHVSDLSFFEVLAEEIPQDIEKLTSFFPGPLTLLLKKKKGIDPFFTAGLDTIAIRVPQGKIIQALLKELQEPLAAPSANLSGRPSPTTASAVWEDLEGKIPLILDGGDTAFGMESTVLSLVGEPQIMRPGALSKEEIEEALSKKVSFYQGDIPFSPGMKYRHYAPSIPLILCDRYEEKEEGACFLFFETEQEKGFTFQRHTFYASLRKMEKLGYKKIYLVVDAALEKEEALMNRIRKAAHE